MIARAFRLGGLVLLWFGGLVLLTALALTLWGVARGESPLTVAEWLLRTNAQTFPVFRGLMDKLVQTCRRLALRLARVFPATVLMNISVSLLWTPMPLLPWNARSVTAPKT